MSAFDRIVEDVATVRADVAAGRTSLTLGTVEAAGTVLLTDGASVTPAAVLAIVGTGDTVLVAQHNRRAYIMGKASPTTTSASLDTLSDVDTTGAVAGDHLVFDGTVWEPGGTPAALRARVGQASISMSGAAVRTSSVSFGVTFAAAPRVFLTVTNDSDSGTQVTAESATTTGFTLRARTAATSTAQLDVNWLAIPDGSLTL